MIQASTCQDPVEALLSMPAEERLRVIEALDAVDAGRLAEEIRYNWRLNARPKQLPPSGDWKFWIVMAGRGFGKTRTGAEFLRERAEAGAQWLRMFGQTAEELYKTMLFGPSGLMTICPPWLGARYDAQRKQVTFSTLPAVIRCYSAEKPDRLRGGQSEADWLDELPFWQKPDVALANIDMGLRLGRRPQAVITMTPKQSDVVFDLVLGPKGRDGRRTPRANVVVTRGRTEENTDLNPEAVASMRSEYGASRLGRQELDAELLERSGKELWSEQTITRHRQETLTSNLTRVVVGVDPTRAEQPGDECGIVVGGLGADGHAYILEDCTVQGSPAVWATAALSAFRKHRADKIVYERNRLGRETEATLRALDPGARWDGVQAQDDKPTRAEPVSALYELGKVHHVGRFPVLEDEMCSWDPSAPGPSPNRVDALVWLVTDLMLGQHRAPLALR